MRSGEVLIVLCTLEIQVALQTDPHGVVSEMNSSCPPKTVAHELWEEQDLSCFVMPKKILRWLPLYSQLFIQRNIGIDPYYCLDPIPFIDFEFMGSCWNLNEKCIHVPSIARSKFLNNQQTLCIGTSRGIFLWPILLWEFLSYCLLTEQPIKHALAWTKAELCERVSWMNPDLLLFKGILLHIDIAESMIIRANFLATKTRPCVVE